MTRRKRRRQFRLWLSDREHQNLELASKTHGMTLSQTARFMLRTCFRGMGLKGEIFEDTDNNNTEKQF